MSRKGLTNRRPQRPIGTAVVLIGLGLAAWPTYLVVRSGPTPEGVIQIFLCVVFVAVGVRLFRGARSSQTSP